MMLALFAALVAGALAAALVCKAIQNKLWVDLMAGAGALVGIWASASLAGAHGWLTIAGGIAGFGAVVGWLRLKATR